MQERNKRRSENHLKVQATIGIKVSGKIYLEQENQWIEIFNKIREEYEQNNILVVLDGKINFGIYIACQNLKWVFKLFNKHQ
jgi:hypothetical protein